MNLDELNAEAGIGAEPQPAAKDQPTAPTAAEFAAMKATMEALAEEGRHNRELLSQFLTRSQQTARPEPDPDEDDEEIEGDIADDFATNGIEALRKRGVLTKKEARELMREEARKVAREELERSQKGLIKDAELAREFPELADNKSELFKRTKAIYDAEIAEDPAAAKNPRTLTRAAKEARAELIAEGKYGRSQGRDRDDDFETERQRRIDAQSGDRSTRRGMDDDDDTLSPGQRRILERFNASGEGFVSEDEYKTRAKKVSMGGIPKFTGGR